MGINTFLKQKTKTNGFQKLEKLLKTMMRYVPIGFQKPHWRRSKYVTSQKALIRFRSLSR